MELNQLIEGDLMYFQHLSSYVKEEVTFSSDESASLEDADCSENDTTDKKKNENVNMSIQDAKCEIALSDKETSCYNEVDCTPSDNPPEQQDRDEDPTIDQNSLQTMIKRGRFSSIKLINQYCQKCKKSMKRIRRKKRTECRQCKIPLQYECAKCNKRYKTYQGAFMHVKYLCKHEDLTFSCSTCYYETTRKENLDNHTLSRHAIEECVDCREKFESNLMKKHRLYECKSKIRNSSLNKDEFSDAFGKRKRPYSNKYNSKILMELYCGTCDKTIEKSKHRKTKRCKECRTSLQYQCATCCKLYRVMISAYNHIRACNNPPEYRCNECNFATSYKMNLTSHVERKHVLQQCEECNTICENKSFLIKHERYECKSNPRYRVKDNRSTKGVISNLPEKTNLRRKISTKNIIKHYCEQCNKITERLRRTLNCHTCSSILRYHCIKCSTSFNRFSHAYKHIRRSCDTARRSRCQYCDYRTARKGDLAEHVRLNHPLVASPTPSRRISECPECGKFILSRSMTTHRRYCSLLPSIACEACDFKTKYERNMREHVKNVHNSVDVDSYSVCPKCKKKFKYRYNIRRHLRTSCISFVQRLDGGSEKFIEEASKSVDFDDAEEVGNVNT